MNSFNKGLVSAALGVVCFSLNSRAESPKNSFQDFRNEILNNYKGFRQTLLDNYADFLNGEWHEYQSLNGEKRYKVPKPEKVPTVDDSMQDSSPVSQPAKKPEPTVTETPKQQTPEKPPQPQPEKAPAPKEKEPSQPSEPAAQKPQQNAPVKGDVTEFKFYDIPVSLPKVDFKIMQKLSYLTDYADQWRNLAQNNVAEKIIPGIMQTSENMGLNGYLTFLMVKDYIESLFPDIDDSSRFSTIHYILANMGYNARIAATNDGIPILLLPLDQMVYGRNYMVLDNKKYYLFAPDYLTTEQIGEKPIYTCTIPGNIELGKDFDLVINELNLPFDPYHFELKGGPLTLTGDLNKNIIPILYKYPQMDMDGFAKSNIQPKLRDQLASQIRQQLESLSGDEAIEALLKFTQKAFQYSTDEDYHGFEKPYFVEETLYYPKNDCEDRAIFYTYFLWNALGKEAQLISFPGHEAAAVNIENPVKGTSYVYDGTTFFVSDPTYVGAKTGMVMPVYRGLEPEIDYTYK